MKIFLSLFLVSCFSGPLNPQGVQSPEVRNPCFQEEPSLNELINFRNTNDCDLFDYKYIFPLVNESCGYWENFFGNTHFVHFDEIFIREEQRLVCLKQDYIESPAFSF